MILAHEDPEDIPLDELRRYPGVGDRYADDSNVELPARHALHDLVRPKAVDVDVHIGLFRGRSLLIAFGTT